MEELTFYIKRIDGEEFSWGGPERAMFQRSSKIRKRLNITIICKRESERKTEAILKIRYIKPQTKSEVNCIRHMLNSLRTVFITKKK